jgi:hypothetical protein
VIGIQTFFQQNQHLNDPGKPIANFAAGAVRFSPFARQRQKILAFSSTACYLLIAKSVVDYCRTP